MNFRHVLAALLLVAAEGSAFSSTQVNTFSFQDALQRAISQSLETQRNDNSLKVSTIDRNLVDYRDDARLSVSASLGPKYTPPQASSSSGSGSGRGTTSSSASENTTLEESYGVQLTKVLWDFGRLNADRVKADSRINVQKSQSAETVDAIRWKVGRAFLRVLAASDVLRVAQQLNANAEAKRNFTYDAYRKGLKPEYDLARAEADLGRTRLSLQKSKDDYEAAKVQLALYLFPAETTPGDQAPPFALKGNVQRDKRSWQALIGPWKNLLPTPSQQTREETRKLAQAELLSIQASRAPQISGGVGLSVNRSQPVPTGSDTSYRGSVGAQVSFSWDIPWNGSDKQERERVALQVADINIQDHSDTRTRSENAANARKQIDLSLQELELNETQMSLISRSLALLRKKYEVGKASASELSTAEDEFINNRLDHVRLNNTVASAVLDLAQAIGVNDLVPIFE